MISKFSRFLSSFNAQTKGKQFEVLVKWFLENDPVRKSEVDKIWLWDDYPDRCRPVMLHRALFGSLERFTGILLEHYAGRLPFWLAPVKVVVAPITNEADDYALRVVSQLKSAGLRVTLDTRNEKIDYKIREHSATKVPLFMAVGKREAAEDKVSMRWLGCATQDVMTLSQAIELLSVQSKAPQNQGKQNL